MPLQSESVSRSVLDIWSHIDPRFGGVGPAAIGLSIAMRQTARWQTRWLAVCDRNEVAPREMRDEHACRVDLYLPRPLSDAQLRTRFQPAIGQTHICHVHGMWSPHTLAARATAARSGKPIVSSAHGNLAPWELRKKGLKKKVYAALFERASLSQSACLRALSVQEAEDYRRFGLTNPIAVVPNGIEPLNRTNPDELITKYPELKGKKVTLFLGRIHYQKGILELLKAWSVVSQADSDAHLLIAGAEQEDTGLRARQIIQQHHLERRVTFTGVVNGSMKMAALSLAHCLCLPSFSEACSVSILEALSIGCPVIITPECNLPEAIQSGAGLLSSRHPQELATALLECLSLTDSKWNVMSCAAKALARSRYDWVHIGQRMDAVYSWLLGAPKPDYVVQ